MAIVIENVYDLVVTGAFTHYITLPFTPLAGQRLILIEQGALPGEATTGIGQTGVVWNSLYLDDPTNTARVWWSNHLTTDAPPEIEINLDSTSEIRYLNFLLLSGVITSDPIAADYSYYTDTGTSVVPTPITPDANGSLVVFTANYATSATLTGVSGGFALGAELSDVIKTRYASVLQPTVALISPTGTLSGSSSHETGLFAVTPTPPPPPGLEIEGVLGSVSAITGSLWFEAAEIFTRSADYCERAKTELIYYFQGKPNWEKLICTYMHQVEELEDALLNIVDHFSLDYAHDAQLDILGQIVDEGREGRDDPEYRVAIRTKIRANVSQGTIEDIIAIIKAALNNAVTIDITELYPAHVQLTVTPDETLTTSELAALARFLDLGKPVGVRLNRVISNNNAFSFRVGHGFGQGRQFARSF